MGRASEHLDSHRQHPLGGNAHLHVGGLAGDREVADEARLDQAVPASVVFLLGLLVGNDPQPHPHLVLLAQVGERQQQACERPLHVVGAAPMQALAFQARLELLRAPGDDVDMAVQQHGARRVLRPHLRDRHRQVPNPDLARHDVA